MLAGGVNDVSHFELSRVDPQIDVGHERTEHQHAIAVLDILGDLLTPHRTFIEPNE